MTSPILVVINYDWRNGGMFGIYIFYLNKIAEYIRDFSQPMDFILKAIIAVTSICLVGSGIKTFSIGE